MTGEGDKGAGSNVWTLGPAPALTRGSGPSQGSAEVCALWLYGLAGAATEPGQPELPRGGYTGDRTGTETRPLLSDLGSAKPFLIRPPAWKPAGTALGQTGPSAEHPRGRAGYL